jgi:hypothetical protein
LYKANIKKCPKERPTCTECSSHGTSCEYAPQKLRNRGKAANKSAAIVVDDDAENEEEDEPEEEPQEDAEGEDPDQEEEAEAEDEQTTSQDYSYPQMNIGNMVTNNDVTTQDTHATQNNYYQPASGLVISQSDPYSTSSQPLATAVPHRDSYSHTLPETQPMHHAPPPVPAGAGTIAPSETRRWTAFGNGGVSASASGSSSKTRRSLPSEPPHTNGQSVSTTNPQPSDWAQGANATLPATTMASVSLKMSYDMRSGQRSREKKQILTNDTAPAADQTRSYQSPPPDLSQQQSTRPSAHYDTSQMASGSGYSNSHERYSGSNTATNHQPAMSAASATPTTMSTSYQTTSSTANQWSGSSSQNDRSYGSNSSYQTPNVYAQAASSKPASASRQNSNMRNNTQQHTRDNSGSYNHQPQQNFSSYSGSSHQNQQEQTPSQQQQQSGWYFQNSHNPSLHQGSQSSGYNYEPWSGV